MYYIKRVRYLANPEFYANELGLYLTFDFSTLIITSCNVHFALYLIWRIITTTKGAKKSK